VSYLEELARQDKKIIVAGLDWNYFANKPFSTTADLLAVAEQVVKLATKCQIEDCEQQAVKSRWKLTKLPEKPTDYVGGGEKYGSYCRRHYVPIAKSEIISQRYNRVEGENARVVIWQDEKFLMVYDIGKGWNLPGGTIDEGETPLECAIREIREETNLTINNLELLCVEWIYYRKKWWKTHLFETNDFNGKIVKQNSEVSDIKFFTYQQANELSSEASKTFLPQVLKSLQKNNLIKHE
jgi:8-oxo-dGTP diphosphatase